MVNEENSNPFNQSRVIYATGGNNSNADNVITNSQIETLVPVVSGNRLKSIGYINTVWAASLLLFLSITGLGFAFSLFFKWPDWVKCEPYFWGIYFQSIFWAVTFLADLYLKRKHEESRIDGYLEFYKKSYAHATYSFYVSNFTNALLLPITSVFQQKILSFYDVCFSGPLSPSHYVAAILIMENITIIFILITYLVKIVKFNTLCSCPDAQRDDWMASFIQDSYSGGEIGLREREYVVEDLLEKQADLLRYLKEQHTRLLQKVAVLTSQLQEKNHSRIT